MVAGIVGIFVVSSWKSEYTNQFLVLTGQRTRNLLEPNTFSMYSVEGDDPSTRLFVCMMQVGIGKADCAIQNSPFAYRACLVGKNKDCLASMDRNWPIDYGFQQCVVKTFNPTTKQINLLSECMRRSETIHGVSVATQNTMRFLGSYNYVSLLLAASCALVGFLIFTAGGIYDGRHLNTQKKHNYHLWNWYEPLSGYNIIIAFVWTVICLAASYYYMFPASCTNCPFDLQVKQGYPTTPWTGIISSGLFFMLLIYYGWFLVEVLTNRNSIMVEGGSGQVVVAPVAGPENQSATATLVYPQSNPAQQGMVPRPLIDPSLTFPTSRARRTYSKFKSQYFNHLGVRLANGSNAEENHEVDVLIPVLIPIFATMLVFVDGPLFVGMITPQHSPLQEGVAFVFIGIILARVAQVVTYKFMSGAFFTKDEIEDTSASSMMNFRRDDPKKFALRVIVLFTYMGSLVLLFIPLYHMMISNDYFNTLKDVGSNIQNVQIFFLIIVAVCPEVVRIVIISLMWYRYVQSARSKLLAFQILFAWEWISRIIFVCIALFGVPPHLQDSSNNVLKFLATPA